MTQTTYSNKNLYIKDDKMTIQHSYLKKQFLDYKEIFTEIEQLVLRGDYTLGEDVSKFEKNISNLLGINYVVGVGSGTDAIFLSCKALNIKSGDEIIVPAFTFIATIGAIVNAGATPIFVDINSDYTINTSLIEKSITPKTKAIIPVHWSGLPCDMDKILKIASKYNLSVIEDACQSIMATHSNQYTGTFGNCGCFSLHPLKNLNVWGDGGFITTNDSDTYNKLTLLRNHGMINRNNSSIYGYNSRLDAIQAIVANHVLQKLPNITNSRINNASYYDKLLKNVSKVTIPPRDNNKRQVFHLYIIQVSDRDQLVEYLRQHKIDAKIHYPIPMHLQTAAKIFKYKKGDFPISEHICDSIVSLPVHEYITKEQQEYVVSIIKEFYNGN